MKVCKIAVVFVLVLVLIACNVSPWVSLVEAALKVGLAAASAQGLINQSYSTKIAAGLDCVDFATTEATSSDSSTKKSTEITAKCAAFFSATLAPGTPKKYVDLAGNFATEIQKMLDAMPAPAKVVNGGAASLGAERAPKAEPVVAFKPADVAKLKSISVKAKAAKAQLISKK